MSRYLFWFHSAVAAALGHARACGELESLREVPSLSAQPYWITLISTSFGKCIAEFQGRVLGNRPESYQLSHRLMLPFGKGRRFQAEAILQDKQQELGPQGTAACRVSL